MITNIQKGIKISFIGTGIESIGMMLDILHHIDIGIYSPEGLLTLFHFIIFLGFIINFFGVLMTFQANRKNN